jgi:4-amino-4-deoxy-L-arabinose transferase-like glycosyltransferase
MSIIDGIAAAIFLSFACLGAGRAALRALGLADKLGRCREPIAFAIGVGLHGWVVFFLALGGWLEAWQLSLLLMPGLIAYSLKPVKLRKPSVPRDVFIVAGLALIAVVGCLNLVQALAPPADADTLAYHFALPKEILRAGHLVFVPRAGDGAIPLLLHMTYLVALGTGGELAVTLWVMLLGWAAAWLVYALARTWLDRRWSLALVLLFMTTPAVVYGSGSGQLELKLTLFALTAAFAVMRAVQSGDWRYACLAGLVAGDYVAAKYLGLVFAAACGLPLLLQRRWLLHGAVFAVTVLAVGWQWYLWNALNTGDPVFPVLYDWLGAQHGYWSAHIQAVFRSDYIAQEDPAPVNLFWFLAYPFVATLDGFSAWDSGRTGFGPFALLVLPFAALGLWRSRREIIRNPLLLLAVVSLIFYVLWFFSGVSQRVRHLLPLYPILLLCLVVAARRYARETGLTRHLAAAALLTLVLQFGGAGVFSINYLRHLATGESRLAFLERNVAGFAPLPWINANLTANDRLLFVDRQLQYYIDVPSYLAAPLLQNLVDLLPESPDPRRFLSQARALGITHVLVVPSLHDFAKGAEYGNGALPADLAPLVAEGCARVVHSENILLPPSRTLPAFVPRTSSSDVVKLEPKACGVS